MSKKALAAVIIIMSLIFAGCTSSEFKEKTMSKEGIEPYPLTEGEEHLLEYFDIGDVSQIILFNAPNEAITMKVDVHCLYEGDENWTSTEGGAISIGEERQPTPNLTGNFTMVLKDNYAIDFNINSSGKALYKTKEIELDNIVSSTKAFLQEYREIEINKEIPVALMVYDSGNSMRSYGLSDYFNIESFKDMDLAMAVTITFSDSKL